MFYHSKIRFDPQANYEVTFNNYSKESIVEEALIPFVNGQVLPVTEGDKKTIVNMKSALKITIFKTEEELTDSDEKTAREITLSDEFQEFNCTDEIIQEFSHRLKDEVKSDLQRKYAEAKNTVFVIMKFGDKDLDSAYEGVMDPIIREFKYEPIRVDKIQDSGIITDQIIDHISTSKYIIADLTGERPNTYYEAGYAHALGKEIILTIRKGTPIHFDLSGHRFIQWDTEADLRKQLRERFIKIDSIE